jgi:hypothetical protein
MSDQRASREGGIPGYLGSADDKADVLTARLRAELMHHFALQRTELERLENQLRFALAGRQLQQEKFPDVDHEKLLIQRLQVLSAATDRSRLASNEAIEMLQQALSELVQTSKQTGESEGFASLLRVFGGAPNKSGSEPSTISYLMGRLRAFSVALVDRASFVLMMATLIAFAFAIGGLAYALIGSASAVSTAIGASVGLLMAVASIRLRPKPRRDTGLVDWDLVFRDPPRIKR